MAKAKDREVVMKRLCLLAVLLFIAGPVYGQGSSQGSSVWIDDLTWPEVQEAIAAGKRTAIVYAGSSEQNGPHMLIGKHSFIARALAQRMPAGLGVGLVCPV